MGYARVFESARIRFFSLFLIVSVGGAKHRQRLNFLQIAKFHSP